MITTFDLMRNGDSIVFRNRINYFDRTLIPVPSYYCSRHSWSHQPKRSSHHIQTNPIIQMHLLRIFVIDGSAWRVRISHNNAIRRPPRKHTKNNVEENIIIELSYEWWVNETIKCSEEVMNGRNEGTRRDIRIQGIGRINGMPMPNDGNLTIVCAFVRWESEGRNERNVTKRKESFVYGQNFLHTPIK